MSNATGMSLGEFERRFRVNKGTLQKAARAAGFETSKGLSAEAVEAMKQEFDVSAIARDRNSGQPEAVLAVVEPISDPLIRFSPLADIGEATIYIPQDDGDVIEQGELTLRTLHQQSTANHNAGLTALIQQRRNKGRKLGAMLAQVEIAEALKENDRQVAAFLEGEGVQASPKPAA